MPPAEDTRSPPTRLLPTERQQRIARLALERNVLRISELAQEMGVSEMTIRRDLSTLEEAGQIERRFGGAVIVEQAAQETSYQVRSRTNLAQKDALAAYAATLIQEGDTLAIDASTTGLALARSLGARRVTVVTNALEVAQALRQGKAGVIVAGGSLRQASGSLVGPLCTEALGGLHIDHAFFSAKGVLIPGGFLDSDLAEAEAKRALLGRAARVTALVDSSKFGVRALSTIAGLGEVDLLVTDAGVPQSILTGLKTEGVPTHVVEAGVEAGMEAARG